ncbi:uncharacterized protein [Euphorbia lathyris]|uniref:uncharacterized protein n=1 Tax=Euphorbia lathyris TaxID=212925 RepID=UPI0033142CB2
MFYFLCRTLLRCRNGYTVKVQNPSMAVSLSFRLFSSDVNPHSFTINYLINKCGLSPQMALSTSKKVRLKPSHNPDLILSFFQKHGFLNAEITEMVMKYPQFLVSKPQKTIFPKVEFFRSKFPSTFDLVRIFTSHPLLLERSLDKQLVPAFNLFKDLFQSEEKAITAVKRNPWVLTRSLKKSVIPRAAVIQHLSSKGLIKLDSSITTLFFCKENCFMEFFMNYREEAPHLLKLYNETLESFDRCGPSAESESASKTAQSEPSKKPNLVLAFLEKLGVSKTQISKMMRSYPEMLSPSEEKILFPKVDFLCSKGISTPELVKMFTSYPRILTKSLENHWIPSFNFFNEWLQSEDMAIAAVRRFPQILCCQPEANMIYNMNTLRENGVPASNIFVLVTYNIPCLEMNSNEFGKVLEQVRAMGLSPSNIYFVTAIAALTGWSKRTWDQKVNAYKRWGWSDEDITAAFKRYPRCMMISEDTIMAVMDFYVNKMGFEASVISSNPQMLSLSLKKRLLPRAAVIQYLSSKGLVELDSGIIRLFKSSEKCFLEEFVNGKEEAPHLLKLYKEKLDILA